MKMSKYNLQVNILLLFILVTIPFNFFYNYFLVKGFFPSIPGLGYPIFGHLLSLFVFLIFLVRFKYFFEFKRILLMLLIFLIYGFIFSILNLMFFSKYAGDFSVFNQSFIALMYIFAFVICFSFYYKFNTYIFKFSFLMMFFIVFFEIDFSSIIPFSFDNIAGTTEGHINYQLVSWFMLCSWFMFFFKEKYMWIKVTSILMIFFMLLVSGGRSELVGFTLASLATLVVYMIFSSKIYQKIFFLLSFLITVVYLPIYFYYKYEGLFEKSRHLQLFDYKESSSWKEREYMYQINVQKIFEHPLTGAYGSHFELGEGAYIHNILSAWQQFGILGFILYIIIIAMPFFIAIFYFFIDRDKFNIYPFFFISTYIVILCVATKPIFWPYVGISVGLLFAYLQHRRGG